MCVCECERACVYVCACFTLTMVHLFPQVVTLQFNDPEFQGGMLWAHEVIKKATLFPLQKRRHADSLKREFGKLRKETDRGVEASVDKEEQGDSAEDLIQKFIRTRYVSVKCFPLCQCEMCYRVLQYVVVCCSILHHTPTLCHTPSHTATHCNTLQYTTTHYNTLYHIVIYCSKLNHTAPYCNEL